MAHSSSQKVYLITGANNGLGLDAARQLALRDDTKKVYLACRTESKAFDAIESLIEKHGIPAEKLAFVPFDASDKREIMAQKITEALPDGEKLDGLIMNAGGLGSDTTGKPTGPNNAIGIVQINFLGHVDLLHTLVESAYLKNDCSIVYSSSEAARGLFIMGLAEPKLPDSVIGYKNLMEGAAFSKYNAMDVYPYVKGMASLYFAAWAKKHPEYHVLSVSPGGTKDTNVGNHDGVPAHFRMMMPVMMPVMSALGLAHPVEVGAKRYVDAVTRENGYEKYPTGTFVASVSGMSGRVGDQSMHRTGTMYADVRKQEAMYQAVQNIYA